MKSYFWATTFFLSFVLFAPNSFSITNDLSSEITSNVSSSMTIDLNSDRIKMLKKIGGIYYKNEDLESALQTYEKIIAINPSDDEATYMLGIICINQKKYKEAIRYIETRIADNSNDVHAFNNLAWLYATAEDASYRDSEKAIFFAQKALVLSPYDKHVWSTLAESYFVNADFEKAKRAMVHLVKLASYNNQKMTQEMVDTYNAQIQKIERAIKTKTFME
ncbi:MAG: tetratricopeptide repeat protein [Pontiellaceae bacterium]